MDDNALVVDASDLTKIYPAQIGQPAKVGLSGLTLQVARGETFGLLGPNGAGKTTAQKLFLGLMRPTRGAVRIFGGRPEDPRVRTKIGFLPENPYFYHYLTGAEFLRFCGGLFGLPAKVLAERSANLLQLVGMTGAQRVQLRKYSKGMLQRIGIAQALINDPDLVLLDEPMSGLDPVGRRELREIILGLKRAGKTIFFNSHILSDVEDVCDRVGILLNGQLVALGSVPELLAGGQSLEDFFVKVVSAERPGADPRRGER
ncbi:MAG: ABC transporter ATP-binding protein [Cyanobacteria bacterium NC_groundwater_1444_Ag_S-0.65um_54_12]|nr:ABC transporter ATP-binding protein [Cyanobacteria bacterium NC_groundwater_1444_Ag_S-0.65um_54_12]